MSENIEIHVHEEEEDDTTVEPDEIYPPVSEETGYHLTELDIILLIIYVIVMWELGKSLGKSIDL